MGEFDIVESKIGPQHDGAQRKEREALRGEICNS